MIPFPASNQGRTIVSVAFYDIPGAWVQCIGYAHSHWDRLHGGKRPVVVTLKLGTAYNGGNEPGDSKLPFTKPWWSTWVIFFWWLELFSFELHFRLAGRIFSVRVQCCTYPYLSHFVSHFRSSSGDVLHLWDSVHQSLQHLDLGLVLTEFGQSR